MREIDENYPNSVDIYVQYVELVKSQVSKKICKIQNGVSNLVDNYGQHSLNCVLSFLSPSYDRVLTTIL